MLARKLGNAVNVTLQHRMLHGGSIKCSYLDLGLGKAVNLLDSSGTSGFIGSTKLVRSLSSSVFVRSSFSHSVPSTNVLRSAQFYQGAHTLIRLQSSIFQNSATLRTTPPSFSFNRPPTAFLHSASTGGGSNSTESDKSSRRYIWIDEEARELIAKAYKRHRALADKSESFPPSLSVMDLERIGKPYHYVPRDFVDKLALNLMKFLRVFVHGFFREKYDHHAVCLETVAAVPGIVGSFHRHLRSLRRMKRDHGWISVLQEEAENERMHLLIFMKVCEPSALERGLVLVAQSLYLSFYSFLYLIHSRAAHRLTGYLEEEAHRAYTDYLQSIDSGKLPNKPAPQIAKTYYRLADDATMRDVVLHVRADEAMHRDVNHEFGDKYLQRDTDTPLTDVHVDRT